MPEIIPFRAIYYNKEKAGDLSQVVAPPYDVISAKEQDQLYSLNPVNVVRIILGKKKLDDTASGNQYTRGGEFLEKWLDEGILKEVPEPAIYVYVQEYMVRGKKRKRTGIIAAIKLEDDDSRHVLPHENTFSDHEIDRLCLLRATRTNASPIFSLISDDDSVIEKLARSVARQEPLYSIELDGVTHRLWAVGDKNLIEETRNSFREKPAIIADGHHRYAVSRKYREDLKAKGINAPDSDYVMMYLADLNDENLIILPTHRLVKSVPVKEIEKLLEDKISVYFDVSPMKDGEELFSTMEESARGEHVFGLYLRGGKFYLLRLKSSQPVEDDWIDVSILHHVVFGKILGMEDTFGADGGIIYLKSAAEAEQMVEEGDFELAFFLNPTHIDEVVSVACAGGRMPHKSTYFYPKLLSGLVMRRMYGFVS